jgi:integrase
MQRGRVKLLSLGNDYEAACSKLRSLKSEGLPRTRLTVAEAGERWLESYVPTARSGKSVALARRRVEMYLVPFMGHMLLDRVQRDDLRAYRLHLEATHLSVQSVRHVLSDARCLLNWCEDSELMDRAPIPKKLLPRIQETPPKRLTDDEVERIVALPEPYGFICRLALGTGLRWGELSRATKADVQGGMLVVHQTKSGRVRRVPLSGALLEELRFKLGRLCPLKDASGLAQQVRRRTGLTEFHAHRMRHTFACRWIESGGTLAALQEILGHASIVTTQRYARLDEAHVRAEAQRIEGRLASKVASSE